MSPVEGAAPLSKGGVKRRRSCAALLPIGGKTCLTMNPTEERSGGAPAGPNPGGVTIDSSTLISDKREGDRERGRE